MLTMFILIGAAIWVGMFLVLLGLCMAAARGDAALDQRPAPAVRRRSRFSRAARAERAAALR